MEQENELEIWKVSLDDYVIQTAWNANGKQLLAGTASGKLFAFGAASGDPHFSEQLHQGSISAIATHPHEASKIATVGQDGCIVIYDTLNLKIINRIKSNAQWIEHVQWSPDGKYLAAAGGKEVMIMNYEGKLTGIFCHPQSTVSAIFWKKDSSLLAIGGFGSVQLINPENLKPEEVLEWPNSLISLSWNRDGKYIAAGTQDCRIQFWKLPHTPGKELQMSGYATKIKALSWSGDNKSLATNCGVEIVIWNISGKGPEGTSPQTLKFHQSRITQVAYQNQASCLASADQNGMIVLWLPNKGSKPLVNGVVKGVVSSLSWSPNDEKLAIGTADGMLNVWALP
ncbi:WD40 repeat protein [Pedobacter sp. UYP24]